MDISLPLLPILLLATPCPLPPQHIHTALTGRPSLFSIFTLSLGLQTPLTPTSLNFGEFPACAALTTGYVFRIENAATVYFLQRMGRTGCLTRLDVSSADGLSSTASVATGVPALPTLILISHIVFDFSTVSTPLILTLSILLLSRLLSTLCIRARTQPSWHGAPEPNVTGDLFILLSEDRFVRLKGLVDDLKAVTSGSWLSRPTHPLLMNASDWISRILIYVAVVALANASGLEKLLLVATVMVSHLLLIHENSGTETLVMNGRVVEVSEGKDSVKKYARRLDMAEQLVREVGRSDFAVRLGMINPEQAAVFSGKSQEESDLKNVIVTM